MIRIRRLHRTVLPAGRDAIAQVQDIFRQNFRDVESYAEKIPGRQKKVSLWTG